MADDQQSQPETDEGRQSLAKRLLGLPKGLLRAAGAVLAIVHRHGRITYPALGGLFVLATALFTVRYVQDLREKTIEENLNVSAAMELLDSGEYSEARRMARLLPQVRSMSYEEMGDVHYIIGASIALETDDAWDEPNRPKFYALAAKHLKIANQRRLPAGREAEARLLWGRCLVEAGHYEQATVPLLGIDDSAPALRPEAQRLLAIAYLKSTPPDLAKASQYSEAYSAAPQATTQMQQQATLLQAEVLLAQDELDRCGELLKQVQDDSPLRSQRQMLQGRMLMRRAALIDAAALAEGSPVPTSQSSLAYERAMSVLRNALSHHTIEQGESPQASYLIGVALRGQGQREAAVGQFVRTRKRFYNTPESFMAGLEEAELLLELKRYDDAKTALEATADQDASDPNANDPFGNPYITQKRLRERIDKAFQTLYEAGRFDLAVPLASTLSPQLGSANATELHAESLNRWGEHLEARTADLPREDQAALLQESRKKFREAGNVYAELAHHRYTTRDYPTDLWRSGRSFNRGRDYESAITLFNKYLETEAQTERALVLIDLAGALLSLDRVDEAIATVEACLRDYPKDPAIYEARLLASRAFVEKGDREKAKQLLQANLHHQSLTPRSDAWRDSLFALGMVLHDEGQALMLSSPADAAAAGGASRPFQSLDRGHALLHESIRRLSEAVARYPDAPQTPAARYAIAESYRSGAQMPLAKRKRESIERRRAALNRQIEDELSSALLEYDRLIAQMNEASHNQGEISEEEEKALRNAYFARGSVLYDLGQYQDSIKAYSTATSRYQHEPAAIEAYVQIASCYRRLNKPNEARGTLEQAKLVMERIRPDADFAATTRFGRDEWTELLNWMSAL